LPCSGSSRAQGAGGTSDLGFTGMGYSQWNNHRNPGARIGGEAGACIRPRAAWPGLWAATPRSHQRSHHHDLPATGISAAQWSQHAFILPGSIAGASRSPRPLSKTSPFGLARLPAGLGCTAKPRMHGRSSGAVPFLYCCRTGADRIAGLRRDPNAARGLFSQADIFHLGTNPRPARIRPCPRNRHLLGGCRPRSRRRVLHDLRLRSEYIYSQALPRITWRRSTRN
jgi:hypothetical protein